MSDIDEGLHFFPVEPDDLTPINMLIMVAKESGFEIEHGYRRNQYIMKRRATEYAEYNYFNVKTLYCAVRTDGDRIRLTGAIQQRQAVALVDPKCFEKLKAILEDPGFLLTSSKDFSTPICSSPSI